MAISLVTINNKFIEWLTRTNDIISYVNGLLVGSTQVANTAVAGRLFNLTSGSSHFSIANGSPQVSNTVTLSVGTLITDTSNTGTTSIPSANLVNVVHQTTRSAFSKANTACTQSDQAGTNANNAYGAANVAYTHANNAYNSSNTLPATIATARSDANTAYTHANNAYNSSNTVLVTTQAGFNKANSANILASVSSIIFVIDGGGSVITTGQKGDIEVPFNCSINRSTLLADQSGSIILEVWRRGFSTGYPPVAANLISTNTSSPRLSSALSNQDSTLTGWTTSLIAGDILRYNVVSASTVTRATLALKVLKT